MKKTFKIIIYVLALVPLVGFPVKLIFFNADVPMQPKLKEEMISRFQLDIRNELPKPYQLSNLTVFKWDKLYIFGPYNKNKDIIEKRLGFTWDKAGDFEGLIASSKDEAQCLLVFVSNGEVVQYEIFSRSDMDFSLLIRDGHFSPDEVVINRVGKNSVGVIF